MAPPTDFAYRPDIDGLRAVAIGSVVVYHAFPDIMPGGFIGVDIFFVISGYLISSILLTELANGRMSLVDFYARRVRRLFPALSVVLFATLAFGWYYLLPHEATNLGTHAAAGAAYVINFVLREETGYFDTAAEAKPLLHLWSLAIEEQFYLAWPALLLLAHRFQVTLVGISILTILSLGLCLAAPNREAAFYLPFYRVWELSAGGLLAYLARQPEPMALLKSFGTERRPAFATITAMFGLGLIVMAAFTLDRSATYPGAWTLVPCLGALAILVAGPEAAPNKWLLGARPVVFIGLISYALYLWHWPLLSLAHILGDGPDWRVRSAAIAVAFGLATATYLFLERPIRRAPARASALYLFAISVVLACAGLAAGYGVLSPRLDDRPHREIAAAIADWKYPDGMEKVEHDGLVHWTAGRGPRLAVFIGDSTMEQFWPRIARHVAPGSHWTAKFLTRGGCPPFIADPDNSSRWSPECIDFLPMARAFALESDAEVVVISGAWRTYLKTALAGKEVDDHGERSDAALAPLAAFLGDLQARGKTAWLVLMVPSGPQLSPDASVKRSWDGSAIEQRPQIDRRAYEKRLGRIVARLREAAETTGTRIVDPASWLCDATTCWGALDDGTLLYKDAGHLRASFVAAHAELIDAVFETGTGKAIE